MGLGCVCMGYCEVLVISLCCSSHQLNRKIKRVEDDLMRAEELVDELTEYVCVSAGGEGEGGKKEGRGG